MGTETDILYDSTIQKCLSARDVLIFKDESDLENKNVVSSSFSGTFSKSNRLKKKKYRMLKAIKYTIARPLSA